MHRSTHKGCFTEVVDLTRSAEWGRRHDPMVGKVPIPRVPKQVVYHADTELLSFWGLLGSQTCAVYLDKLQIEGKKGGRFSYQPNLSKILQLYHDSLICFQAYFDTVDSKEFREIISTKFH